LAENLSGVIEELERRLLLPVEHLSVFCVGSVARGWANADSDYDLTVVTPGPWPAQAAGLRAVPVPLDPGRVPIAALSVGGRRWELKYWQDQQVDQMLAKVTWEQFEGSTSAVKALVETEELFLERLVSCLPLSGAAWVQARRRDLNATAFRAFVTTRSLAEADGAVEDAVGQLGAGDLDSAVLSARKALGHIVDALLECRGNYGSHLPKWRARRFREAAPKALSFQDYWALETMRDFDPAAPQLWVRRVVKLCKDLSMDVEIS
jgi:hypothetical protein